MANWILVPTAIYLVLHLLGWAYPSLLWGTDQLHYYPISFGLLFVLISVSGVGLASHVRLRERIDGIFGRWLEYLEGISTSPLFKGTLLLLFFLLAYGMRVRGHHLGDSSMWFRVFEIYQENPDSGKLPFIHSLLDIPGLEYIPAFEPLDIFLHFQFYRLIHHLFGATAGQSFEWISCIAGVFYSAVLWLITGHLCSERLNRLTVFLLLLTLGTIQLFFGYGETYTLVSLAAALYFLSALRFFAGGSLLAPLLWLLFSISLHAMACCLIPSLIYLIWHSSRGRPLAEKITRPAVYIPTLISGAALGLVLYTRYYPNGLPLWTAREAGTYALFSIEHSSQLLNTILLISPFGLLWGIGNLIENRRQAHSPVFIFTVWSAIGSGLLILLHDAYLGGRDWDLRSFPCLFYTLWGIQCLLMNGRAAQLLGGVRLAIIPLMILHTGSWLGINASPERSAIRLGELLKQSNQADHYRAFSQGHYYKNIRRDLPRAADYLRRAIALAPPDSLDPEGNFRNRYRKHLAQVLAADGKYERAVEEFAAAYSDTRRGLTTDDLSFYRSWVLSLYKIGERLVDKGMEKDAGALWHEMIRRAQQMNAIRPDSYLLDLQGRAYIPLGEYATAAETLERSVACEPDTNAIYSTLIHLARAQQSMGDRRTAIETLRRAVAIDSESPAIHYSLGNLYYKERLFDEAIDSYRETIRLEPAHPKAHSNLAIVLIDQERYGEAEQIIRQGIDLQVQDPTLPSLLGILLVKQNRIAEGIDQLQQTVDQGTTNIEIYPMLFRLYRENGRLDEARALYRQLLTSDINPSSDILTRIGLDLFSLGDVEGSTRAYRKSLQIDSGNVTALTNLGWNLYLQGKLLESTDTFGIALRQAPNPTARFNLGLVYMARGKVDSARTTYAQAVEKYGAAKAREIGAVDDLQSLAESGIQREAIRKLLRRYWEE